MSIHMKTKVQIHLMGFIIMRFTALIVPRFILKQFEVIFQFCKDSGIKIQCIGDAIQYITENE